MLWESLSRAPLGRKIELAGAAAPRKPGAARGPHLPGQSGGPCEQDLCHQILLVPFLFFIGYIRKLGPEAS